MRVISGKYRGKNLIGFDIDGTRPTMDRIKESMFAMIQNKINGSVVLDLFAGSGSLGIEALSNGAKSIYLVDNNIELINIIKKNTSGMDNVSIIKSDYRDALNNFKDIKFDIIFLDPPYKTNYIEESIKLITLYDLLDDKGIIVCESDSIDKIIYDNSYTCIKDKKYGDKYIVILKKVC